MIRLFVLLLLSVLSSQTYSAETHLDHIGVNNSELAHMRIHLDEKQMGSAPHQLDWILGQLTQEGFDLTPLDSTSLVFQGSAQQLARLAEFPFVSDIEPLVYSPFDDEGPTANKGLDIITPPSNHLNCDSYSQPADPRTFVEYTGEQNKQIYYSNILHQEYPGIIYLPSNNGRVASGQFPLAILVHGRHYDYDWYQQIQQHLARNGIASAAIQYSEDHSGQDYDEGLFLTHFENHMDVLFGNESSQYNPAHNKLNGKIALIGHSMGGGFAVKAAQWLNEQSDGHYDTRLMSVVNLAPNPQYDDWYLTAKEAQGLLVIFGSNDNDSGVNTPGSSGFLTYDRSGYVTNEYSFNGYWRNRFTKSMAYIKGANHNSFIDDDVATNQGPHHDLALGYINAYLRWSLKNDYSYHSIFKQQHPFHGQNNVVSLQYSDGRYRRVLDHFEGPYTGWNALGGRNKFYEIERQKGPAKMSGNTHKSAHETNILQLGWDASDGDIPVVQFHLPIPYRFGTDYRNLTRLRYLSFRVGQLAGAIDSDVNLDFTIRLTSSLNGVTKSRHVALSDVGHIPTPLAVGQNAQTKTAMNTVMIPLCVFAGIDYERVTKISFQFNHPSSPRGIIHVDSLEFLY